MKYENIYVDQKVVYIPKHCRSGLHREGWEEGIVVSKDIDETKRSVFVRYWNPKTGAYNGGAQSTYCEDLVRADAWWIPTYPKRELPLGSEDLEVGLCYVVLHNPTCIFRCAVNKSSCIYIDTRDKIYRKGSFGGTKFDRTRNEGYRPATLEEIEHLTLCIQANGWVPKPIKSINPCSEITLET